MSEEKTCNNCKYCKPCEFTTSFFCSFLNEQILEGQIVFCCNFFKEEQNEQN